MLNSLHRYQPRIHIVLIDSQINAPDRHHLPMDTMSLHMRARPKESNEINAKPNVNMRKTEVKVKSDPDEPISSNVSSNGESSGSDYDYEPNFEMCCANNFNLAFTFPETQFIAVTAYQNEEVIV